MTIEHKMANLPQRLLLASLGNACLLTSAVAEQLPEVVVSAPATFKAESVPAANLATQRSATSDTAALLREIPGLHLQSAGGVSSLPVLRGLADDRLRIKVDGMDLISACGNHMNPPLSYVDPSRVERVQVFAGISPVSVGGDGLGSAIQVESAPPVFAAAGETLHEGEVSSFYRSNNAAWGANLNATLANDKFSLRYQGAHAEAENYRAGGDFKPAGPAAAGRDWLDADEVGSSGYETNNHALDLGVRHQDQSFELKLGLQDIPYQSWPNQRMDMTGNDSTQINLRYGRELADGSLDVRAYREHTRHAMQFHDDKLYWYGPNNTAPQGDGVPGTLSGGMNGYAAGMPMDTEGDNLGLLLNVERDLSERDLLRVGGEAQRYRLDDWWAPSGKGMWPNTFWNIHDGQRDRLALFGEWEATWSPRWLSQLGLRYERVAMDAGTVQGYNSAYDAEAALFNAADRSRDDNNVDLVALLRFTPSAAYTIEAGYARKNRSPNLYERYTWSSNGMAMRMINMTGDGNGYVGNVNLEPETANTLSASLTWRDTARWQFKVSPYFTYVENYIDAQRCVSANSNCGAANQTATGSFVYLQFVNQTARLYGLDISGEAQLLDDKRYGAFDMTALLSYGRGTNIDSDDNLYNIMPLNAKLALNHTHGAWRGTLEWEAVAAKERVSQVRNELPTDSYHLFHLRSSYNWQQVRLDFGVENLFDKFYYAPLGGAYSGQGKTMSGTDVPWGVGVPGMGRSIYVGVTLFF